MRSPFEFWLSTIDSSRLEVPVAGQAPDVSKGFLSAPLICLRPDFYSRSHGGIGRFHEEHVTLRITELKPVEHGLDEVTHHSMSSPPLRVHGNTIGHGTLRCAYSPLSELRGICGEERLTSGVTPQQLKAVGIMSSRGQDGSSPDSCEITDPAGHPVMMMADTDRGDLHDGRTAGNQT